MTSTPAPTILNETEENRKLTLKKHCNKVRVLACWYSFLKIKEEILRDARECLWRYLQLCILVGSDLKNCVVLETRTLPK